MAYIFVNPNPSNKLTGDCVIRAISLAMNQDWETTYIDIMIQGFMMHDMPSSNEVWSAYLRKNGFVRRVIPNTCPDCYSTIDFTRDFPQGEYILATGTHVVAIKDGNYFDTWDSGNEIPIFYWKKEA